MQLPLRFKNTNPIKDLFSLFNPHKSETKREKIQTWKAVCKYCQEDIYYYPANLLLETYHLPVDTSTNREVVCKCYDCDKTQDLEFPKDFKRVV